MSFRKHFSLVFPENGEGRALVREDSLIRHGRFRGAATSPIVTHANNNRIDGQEGSISYLKCAKENERIHTRLNI